MAQPIPLKRIQPDPERDIRARLAAAPIEHADAVLAGYALLQELQDHGVLEFLRGATGAGGDIVTRLSEAANTPESIAAIRNLISLLRIAGSIDPAILHGVAEIVTKKAEPEAEAPGIWKIARQLGSKESRRALGAAAFGLSVFGRVLIARQLTKR